MSYTADQVAALEAAIASGVTSISYSDKRVEYRSLADLRQALAEAKLSVAGLARIKQFRVTTQADKGL